MSPLAWVGIGCGVILVVGMIAMMAGGYFLKKKVEQFSENPTMAAAELIVRANPELELVSKDADNATLTIKNKKTGEVITINAKDIEEGRLTFETDQGTTTVDASGQDGSTLTVTDDKGQTSTFQATSGSVEDLPSWVPAYPGGTTLGSYDTKGPEGRNAAFTVTTQDPPDQVIAFYEAQLEGQGFSVQKNTYAENGKVGGGTVTGKSSDDKHTLNVFVSPSGEDTTQALVTFIEKQ